MQHVALYAAAREAFGSANTKCRAQTLGELIAQLGATNNAIAQLLPTCSFLVNNVAQTAFDFKLNTGDKVDVLPRFAGG